MPVTRAEHATCGRIRFEIFRDPPGMVIEKFYPIELDGSVTFPDGKRRRLLYRYFHPKSFRRHLGLLMACPIDKWTGDERCKDAIQTLQIFHPYKRLKNLGARCKSGELKKKRASHIRAIDRTIARIDRKMPMVAPAARKARAVAGLGYYY